jgi:16S rRNA (cytidine1402-2'-O)-methyltransferase
VSAPPSDDGPASAPEPRVPSAQTIRRPALYVIATPIGNLEDVTYRAVRVLSQLDALACEDTRTTRKILDRYGIPRPPAMFAHHEHNEISSTRGVLKLLDEGKAVGLCTDAGMPGVSDPGYRLVNACVEAGHPVEILPGATASVSALVASGLPTASFTFHGFPPRKPGPRRKLLAREAAAPHTLVLYESPHRVGALLADALAVLGDRRAAVAIELTKLHERVERGWLAELAPAFAGKAVRGEVCVVIAGDSAKLRRGEAPEGGAADDEDEREEGVAEHADEADPSPDPDGAEHT